MYLKLKLDNLTLYFDDYQVYFYMLITFLAGFRTNRDEMARVCSIFDRDGDGFIDYYEFISALYPNGKNKKTSNDDDEYVEDEVSSCLKLL